MRDVWQGSFQPSKESTVLWRYFQTEYLLKSLESSKLYFAAAKEFDDKFEGAVRVVPIGAQQNLHGSAAHFNSYFQKWSIYTKVSCWHRADTESDAMWRLYAMQSRGVAVRTTVRRLSGALKPFRIGKPPFPDLLWRGDVQYIDLTTRSVPSNATRPVGPLKRFFYKHLPFAWEKEYRVAVGLCDRIGAVADLPTKGVLVDFDPAELIEAIVLGPDLPHEDIDRLRKAAASAALSDRFVWSTLLGSPKYL